MKKLSKGLLFLALGSSLIGVTSCSEDAPWSGSDSEGAINLNCSTDGRVMRQTRADDTVSPIVPSSESFSVSLVNADGSYSKKWSTVESFNHESSFPIGDYNITASAGDPEREGFEAAYFAASDAVHVSPGATSDVELVATLANSMVSIRYTDKFKENFSSYSAALQSEGHDWVVFAQNESRPAYVTPSQVKLNLTLTNLNGEQVTIQPASFEAVARHHYVVTVGVDGAAGDLALDVQFDDDVVSETVMVSLGDELFSAPAPTLQAKNFNPEHTAESYEFAIQTESPEFHVFAFGGLKSATLTVVTDGYSPAFGRSVELVNADALTQQQLLAEGVDCSGFFRNPDKMGVVNIKKFLETLPAGNYSVELQVVDAMTRTSEPLKFTTKITAVEYELEANAVAEFMATEITVDLNTNCEAIKNNVKFYAPDSNNRMVEATVKSVTAITQPVGKKSRAAGEFAYRYVLEVASHPASAIDVEARLGNKTRTVKVPMASPVYNVTTDAFAHKVVLKIEGKNDAQTKFLVNNLQFKNGETLIPSANVSHNSDTGLITIVGLSAASSYGSLKAVYGTAETPIAEFTTESETALPNSNFANQGASVVVDPLNVGGKFNVKVGIISDNYQITSSINRNVPAEWANVNDLTCWSGSQNNCTWYKVPSTFFGNGGVLIRSVGYNHNGPSLATSGGQFNTNYYCETTPTDADLQKAAGELFLGSYSFDGSEHRTEGIAWATRPSSLSFEYVYNPVGSEQGEAYVRVYGANGSVLSEKTVRLSASSERTTATIALGDYPFNVKAAKIAVGFRSTRSGVTPSVTIPTGSALSEGISNIRGNLKIGANSYHALAVGSQLTLYSVNLGYEATSATKAATRSKSSKKTRR